MTDEEEFFEKLVRRKDLFIELGRELVWEIYVGDGHPVEVCMTRLIEMFKYGYKRGNQDCQDHE